MNKKKFFHISREQWKRALNKVMVSAVSFIASIVIVGIVIWISGYSPIETYVSMVKGAFRSQTSIALVFSEATPLLFTGLAFAIAFRVRLVNVGIEGQMMMGALVGAIVGHFVTFLPHIPHVFFTMLIAGLTGMVIALFIGFLKVKLGANEVIISMMLNSIFTYIGSYLANGPLRAKVTGVAQTEIIQETALLSKLVSKSQLTTGYLIGLFIAIVLAFILDQTVLGYKIRIAGNNRIAGETYGIKATKLYYIAFMISGFVAALGGSIMTQGPITRFSDGAVAGYGFQGISVAALGAYNPLGVIFSSFLYGVLRAGSYTVNRTTNIPYEFVDVIQVMVVVFVSAPQIIFSVKKWFKKRKTAKPKHLPGSSAPAPDQNQ